MPCAIADYEQNGTGNGCSTMYDQGKYGLSNLNGSYLARVGATYINATYPNRRAQQLPKVEALTCVRKCPWLCLGCHAQFGDVGQPLSFSFMVHM